MTETPSGLGSPGALLRAARERQGLHIAALAAAIKVAPRKLDALENDRWDELPDATFTRALAQTVCRSLKIDARPVLELLPQAAASALEASGGGLNMPFHDRPGRHEPGLAGAAIRPMVWAALALMLAALGVYFMPEGLWTTGTPTTDTVVAVVPPAPAMAPVASAPALPVLADGALPAPNPSASAATALAAPVPPAQVAAPASAPSVAAAAPVASAAVPQPAVAAALVQLHASRASWVEVRDARGQVLLSRVVGAGEGVGLDGTLPMRLVIGNAAATQLAFRGQAVDFSTRTRDNVARVELQ
jgi:cytoskeleton protein RodZ